MRFTIGAYEISLTIVLAFGLTLYVTALIRISREQKARWKVQNKPCKPCFLDRRIPITNRPHPKLTPALSRHWETQTRSWPEAC
jgi:hypothetical protein